jgi:fatty-acyl-CoA synthase
VHGPHVSPG